eukprot:7813894-Prorocentrum_lima.AAC.1
MVKHCPEAECAPGPVAADPVVEPVRVPMVEAVSVSSETGTTEAASGRARSRPPSHRRLEPGPASSCGMTASMVEDEFLALARKEATLKGELARVEQRRQ